ncbi:glycosyltransferase [Flavobacterium sp. RSP46]|uniref:glycosyltransferase n=1 Tax=Flavobacterium sp. RSP46 TaxID=2497486 RepID=UPI000F85BF58|nr:glycosyltransferase [Flavobacterium sp. RSP46]RTY91101.1 glycosyltransferase [Flavobacterium sp. RSP46]
MKILFLNFRNNPSSALLRISESLVKVGVSVCIFSYLSLVKEKKNHQASGFGRALFTFLFWYDIFVTRFVYKKTGRLFSRNTNLFSNILASIYAPFSHKFDLIHLHWIGHGFISTHFLIKIKVKKIVVTLHDYYFITGGCHIPGECLKYTKSCSDCPAKNGFIDFTLENFRQKEHLYKTKQIYATAPSEIMKSKIVDSYLGHFFQEVLVVPNPIDISIYKPLCVDFKKEFLFNGLPIDKKFLLFVSNNLIDYNKGMDLLLASIKLIKNPDSICLLTVGNNYSKISDELNFSHHHFGEINSTIEMVKIYNLAYITVVPSRFESFSQVTLESMSCGSPVIAFDSSGPSEIITDNLDGFLVKSFSIENFSESIDNILADELIRDSFAKKSREKVVLKYSYEAIGGMMKNYYKKIMDA